MRILVMGAGAIGSVVGGFLAQAGHAVTLVGRRAHMDAVREHGLRVRGIWGDHYITALETAEEVDAVRERSFDLILITVKSYDTAAAAVAIGPLLTEDTLVCSYQNGLGNAETIAAVAGWRRTIGARAIYGVWLPEAGVAEVTVIANPTAIGSYDPATPEARMRAIVQAMDDAGLPTVYTDRIETVLWGKVAYNCALNPLSALLDVPYGALLDTEHTRSMLAEIVHELYAVASAKGIALEPPAPGDYVTLLFDELIPPTAGHYASMREDVRRHRRTEIDALNGAIVRYGQETGVPTPTNGVLTRDRKSVV